MAFHPADIIRYPFWLLALASGAKSFSGNKVLGSPGLNRRGLHAWRISLAHRMAWMRRRRLAALVSAQDRDAFARDGFVLKPDFLPALEFERLRSAVLGTAGPAREMTQGDTITRRLALDATALARLPEAAALLRRADLGGLVRYVGASRQEPLWYVQTILSHVKEGAPDPQTELHADTFHPTVKAWLFLTDVAADEGPFVYVPGSHRLTPERLAWERETSINAAEARDKYSARGSFRIRADELERLSLPPPKAFAVAANTLVVADTVGFHARGFSARPSRRAEIWAYGRRNPFLPWTGLDPLSLPGVAERRVSALWRWSDFRERLGLKGNPWRKAGELKPLDDSR